MEPNSPEPSMEDILASIKRIIAEEPAVPEPAEARKPARRPISFASYDEDGPDAAGANGDESPAPEFEAAPIGDQSDGDEVAGDDVLELTSSIADAPMPATAAPQEAAAALVSDGAAIASRQSLAALSAMIVKPEQGGDNTLEGLVREMLRPVLKEWLDARLPEIVERMVALEISRITSRGV